jgi:hypothetical protein
MESAVVSDSPRNLAPDLGQYTSENPQPKTNQQKEPTMNQEAKTTRKPKTKSNVEVPDLKPQKDPKAGIIAVLIGGPTTMPPPTTK